MLDLVFLILMIIVLVKALRGEFYETLCNFAMIIGIIAAVVGMVSCFFADSSAFYLDLFSTPEMGVLNLLVLVIAVLLRPVAKHLVKLQQDKMDEIIRSYEEDEKRANEKISRGLPTAPSAPPAPNDIDDILDENGCIDIHKKRNAVSSSVPQSNPNELNADYHFSDGKP